MILGFIGFGEVGYEIAKGLNGAGLTELYAFDAMQNDEKKGDYIKQQAQSANVTLLGCAEVVAEQCDFILLVTPGAFALTAAKSILKKLQPGKVVVDLSTSLPDTKKMIHELVKQTGALFADGALMASLSQSGYKVPILLAGAGSSQVIQALTPYGMIMKKISDTAGDAIAVKLVRSIYMKGIAALGAEMLEAANILKVDGLVLDSIGDTLNDKPFAEMNNHLVLASAWHGERQVHEMQDVSALLNSIGISATMTEATIKRLEWFRDLNSVDYFQNDRPQQWKELIQLWDLKRCAQL